MIPLVYQLLTEVAEVTEDTNKIVKPMLDEDVYRLNKAAIDDVSRRRDQQDLYFYEHPEEFESHIENIKKMQK